MDEDFFDELYEKLTDDPVTKDQMSFDDVVARPKRENYWMDSDDDMMFAENFTLKASAYTSARNQLNERFADLMISSKNERLSATNTMLSMLKKHPGLIYVVEVDDSFELHMLRALLQEAVKLTFPNITFTSFERGLKHAGLFVDKTTHGKNRSGVKVWGIRANKNRQSQSQSRIKKLKV